jgi:hypothetical protein
MFVNTPLLFVDNFDRLKTWVWFSEPVAVSLTPRLNLHVTNGRCKWGLRTYIIAIPYEQLAQYGVAYNPRKRFASDAEAIKWANGWIERKNVTPV